MFKSGFEIVLAVLNHFPLFALMLRFKDPRRLSGIVYLLGGVYFELCRSNRKQSWIRRLLLNPIQSSKNVCYLYLHVSKSN
jgi:hypothetical protein